MTLKELIEMIESQKFIVKFSVLSGFKTVIFGLENDEIVSKLIALLRDNVDNQQIIMERIEYLIPQNEAGYMHTHDISILVYTFALNETNNQILIDTITSKLRDVKGLYWARKLAEKIFHSAQIEYDEA